MDKNNKRNQSPKREDKFFTKIRSYISLSTAKKIESDTIFFVMFET